MEGASYIHHSKYMDCIKKICDFYGVEKEKFFTKTRKREVVRCRQVAAYVFKKYTRESLKNIGCTISPDNPFDHTTVIHSVKTVLDDMATNDKFKNEVYEIVSQIIDFKFGEFKSAMAYRPDPIDKKKPIKGHVRPY